MFLLLTTFSAITMYSLHRLACAILLVSLAGRDMDRAALGCRIASSRSPSLKCMRVGAQ